MTKEKMIEILMYNRCTKNEAINYIKNGTVVLGSNEIDDFLKDFNTSAYDANDIVTVERIETGKVVDFDCITFQGEKFYISYVID